MKYFSNVKTLADLSRQYKRLSKIHHPDAGGSTQSFQELQSERDKLARNLMKRSGMNDSEIDITLGDEDWMENVAQFGSEILASGDISKTLMEKGKNIADDLFAGDPDKFTTNGKVDLSKVTGHIFGMFGLGKQIDEKKADPKQIGEGEKE